MTLIVLTAMIFLVTLGLSISGFYFFVEVPASKRRMRSRLAAIQQLSEGQSSGEVGILRDEVLSEIPALNRIFLEIPLIGKLQLFIQQAATEITPGMLLLISFALILFAIVVGLLANLPNLILMLLAAAAGLIPFFVVAFKRQRRFSKFEELFPEAIDLLARSVRAGHAFTNGLELISRELPEPVASEFRVTYEQQNLGMPLREALRNLSVRVPLGDVSFFVSALQIQRESGGNLAEILDNLSYLIRERFKILRQVKVFTAQGRMTLYLLTGLPPTAVVLLYLTNRDYISLLFTDPIGHWLIFCAVVLQVLGYIVIRKITRIRV